MSEMASKNGHLLMQHGSMSLLLALLAILAALQTRPAAAHKPQRACPMIYKPVCAEQSVETGIGVITRRRTFSNACFASINGARILHQGPCKNTRPPVKGGKGQGPVSTHPPARPLPPGIPVPPKAEPTPGGIPGSIPGNVPRRMKKENWRP